MPLTSPGNDDGTGENHQPTLRKNTAEPAQQTLKQYTPGYKREQRFVVPALGERDMPLDWNQQAHSETRESFSDVGR